MIRRLGQWFVRWAGRYMPDPFVFALLLTGLTALLAMILTPHGAAEVIGFWGDGFWGFLQFSMQMSMILVTGHALAEAPAVRKLLKLLIDRPQSAAQAVALVGFMACLCAWINWGFGLIIGALLARDVALSCRRRNIRVHFPLLAAAGYTGLCIWHGGISGSAPLTVATSDHFLMEVTGTIPTSQTIFSSWNLILTALLLIAIPATLVALHPQGDEEVCQCELPEPEPPATPAKLEGAQRLDHAAWLALAAMALGVIWWGVRRPAIGIDTINFLFMFLGLGLHGSPKAYAEALGEGAKGVGGILLQFPFYAGIMGIMKSAGLIALMATAFVNLSNSVEAATGIQVFYVLVFCSAGLVNMFVPSGGGQWGVQGPIAMEACQKLGLDLEVAVMAVSYGDQWTNMLQPFWALPLLALTGLQARDLIGYTIPVFLVAGMLFAGALLIV